jgi:hypothetical protein
MVSKGTITLESFIGLFRLSTFWPLFKGFLKGLFLIYLFILHKIYVSPGVEQTKFGGIRDSRK